MNSTAKIIISNILLASFLIFLAACAGTHSLTAKHPVELETRPICSDCHTDWKTSLDHRPDYAVKHKFFASQQRQVCGVCHQDSFCADCHAHKEELKPSDKYQDEPERSLPHRGDYLSQHQIDGRINPASCFPCHGRQNNERCRVCHR